MSYLIIFFLLISSTTFAVKCPNGEYKRILKYSSRGPYLINDCIQTNHYLCGQFIEPTYNGYINIDQLCPLGKYYKRTKPIVISPGRHVEFGTDIVYIPSNKRPCGQELIIVYVDFFRPELSRYIYQTKLCNVVIGCRIGN